MHLNLDLLTRQKVSFSSHEEVGVMSELSEARRNHYHRNFFQAETSWSYCFFADRDHGFTVEGPTSIMSIISFHYFLQSLHHTV